ncbi:hypothetical protein [Streptomyces sp. NPDC058268]|uniref:hypothetical protein n=1 Tax=Streptomyces sp. NPDC058268 TaxID=3346413 RepID=UPI0036E3DD17
MTREPQAAYLGLGQIFCVLVLDWRPIWSRHAPGTLPVRTSDAHELLVLRWCSIPAELDAAPTVLAGVAETAPSPDADLDTLAAWRESLPPGVQLTVLRASALIGPWADRPGQYLHTHRPHRAA